MTQNYFYHITFFFFVKASQNALILIHIIFLCTLWFFKKNPTRTNLPYLKLKIYLKICFKFYKYNVLKNKMNANYHNSLPLTFRHDIDSYCTWKYIFYSCVQVSALYWLYRIKRYIVFDSSRWSQYTDDTFSTCIPPKISYIHVSDQCHLFPEWEKFLVLAF